MRRVYGLSAGKLELLKLQALSPMQSGRFVQDDLATAGIRPYGMNGEGRRPMADILDLVEMLSGFLTISRAWGCSKPAA